MEFLQFYCCMDLIAATRAEGGLVLNLGQPYFLCLAYLTLISLNPPNWKS